jgi:hypothetical protein
MMGRRKSVLIRSIQQEQKKKSPVFQLPKLLGDVTWDVGFAVVLFPVAFGTDHRETRVVCWGVVFGPQQVCLGALGHEATLASLPRLLREFRLASM